MRMDMLLESPISVIRLIQIICKLLKMDEKQVIEKLAKSFAKDRNDDLAFASYDSDTLKMIQNIQGELESFGADKSTLPTMSDDLAEGEIRASVGSSDTNADQPMRPPKKSFFEPDTEDAPVKKQVDVDPFAALISELKGESPQEAEEPRAAETVAADAKSAPTKPALEPEEVLDFNVVGQQIKDEIATSALELSEKMKKYTQMTEGLHLYPESTIKKVKAKKQLNDLKKDWNPDDLEDQDKVRREFVTQLFKPNKD